MISNTAEGDEELVEVWAARLQRWGVGGFVPFAANVLRPFGFLGGQALHLLEPVLTAFASPIEIDRLARLLESPETLDRLSDRFSRPDRV